MPAAHVSIVYAFLAGLLSFLSPCVLPLVPGYVSLLSGSAASAEEHKRSPRLMGNAVFFVLGFALVFIALGAAATSIGQFLRNYQVIISQVGGLIIFVLGLHLVGLVKIPALYADKRVHTRVDVTGGAGAFTLGFVFAFGWTPCIGPVLSTILLLAANQGTVHYGIYLLAVYSAGLAVPFLVTSLAIERFARFYQGFKRHLHTVEVVSGCLLLLIGALLFFHRFTAIAAFLNRIPIFNKLLI